jgi:hypothetical protein
MSDRPFFDPKVSPTENSLEAVIGAAYPCYRKLMGLTESFRHTWHFSKSSGWMLKVFEGQKALFYLIILQGGFKISMAVREYERDALLQDAELTNLHEQLSAAKKYAEGYALQFEIQNEGDFEKVEAFITKLKNKRVICK